MPGFEIKSIDKPDEQRSFPDGTLSLVTVGGVTFGRAVFEPNWRWSTCVKPIAQTDSCEFRHLSYVVSGQLRVRLDDGTEATAAPGDVVLIPPGHDAWVVGDEPCVMIDVEGSASDYAVRR